MAEQAGRFYRRLQNLKGRMVYRRLQDTRGILGNEDVPTAKKGGFITILFILVNQACHNAVSYGLIYNMIIYLTKEYHMTPAQANKAVSIWNAATHWLPLLCGFISDSHMGRFRAITFGSLSGLLGILVLWSTAVIPKLRPPPCTASGCASPTTAQLIYLFSAFPLISIGAGCVGCSTAFGVNQLEVIDKSEHKGVLERIFMYYYASSSLLVITVVTASSYILDQYGWGKAFGLPLIMVCLSSILFFIGSPQYYKKKPKKSLLTSFSQVVVATCRNRDLNVPLSNSSGRYFCGKDSNVAVPTDNLRFLNRACIIRDRQRDVAPDGSAVNSWRLCTIEQVQELKALARVLPIWSTGIVFWVTTSKTIFLLLQAGSMDRHISQEIQIPRATFTAFRVITMLIWAIFYDRAILPLASRIKGEPIRFGVKSRIGFGLLLSWTAMVVSAVVEIIRRFIAVRVGNSMSMSALWLLPQCCLLGLAQAFTAVGQLEFFYMELPHCMSSVAVTLLGPGTVVAAWLSDVVSKAALHLTSEAGKEKNWNDISKAPFDCYYSFLAILSFANLLYFLLCSWAYGPCCERCEKNGADLDNV